MAFITFFPPSKIKYHVPPDNIETDWESYLKNMNDRRYNPIAMETIGTWSLAVFLGPYFWNKTKIKIVICPPTAQPTHFVRSIDSISSDLVRGRVSSDVTGTMMKDIAINSRNNGMRGSLFSTTGKARAKS